MVHLHDLKSLCMSGKVSIAICAVRSLSERGIPIPISIFLCLLQACIQNKNLIAGRLICLLIVRNGLGMDTYLGCHLVRMFSICGSMPEAEQTFFRLPKHDSCTWSAIILAHTKFGCADYALKLYSEMHREVEPADYAFNAAIQACSRIFAVNEGNIIHSHIVERCLESDVSLGNTLINMYAKCGTLEDAQCVFNNMSKPGIVAWCSIISGYADQGDSHKALQLFAEMHKGSVQPNLVSFISILKACSSIGCPMAGKLVHAVIVENNCADLKVANSLIDMYGKCGALEDAYLIFHGLFERTVVTWSTLFSVNADYGFGQVTLQLFQQMQHEGAEADHVALAGVLKACSQLHIGKFIHALLLEKGSNLDDFTGSILMEMYFRLLCPSNAYKIFRMLPKGNIQPWNAIITGSLQNGHLGDAISYFQGMQMENVAADNTTYTIVIKACSDNGQVDMGAMLFSLIIESSRHLNEVVGNALVSMYAKCGSLIDACKLFTKLSKRDAVAWSAIIAGHVLHGFGQEALKFYCQMQLDGKGADNVTFFSALKACSLISALNQGKLIHVQVIDSEWESDVQVGNSLIDMYSKCGKLYDAFMVFYNLPRKTVITWNALIAGLAYNNKYHQALELFKGMQQGRLKPNDATFACLLSACNRLGLVQEGRLLFESLSLIHGVSPKLDHYVCLMESMNRAGFLTDAIDLASILPFAPNLVTWTSLLTNCKAYGVLQLGKHALDFLITTEKICTGVCNYGQFFC